MHICDHYPYTVCTQGHTFGCIEASKMLFETFSGHAGIAFMDRQVLHIVIQPYRNTLNTKKSGTLE